MILENYIRIKDQIKIHANAQQAPGYLIGETQPKKKFPLMKSTLRYMRSHLKALFKGFGCKDYYGLGSSEYMDLLASFIK